MTIPDLKGHLLARAANLEKQVENHRTAVLVAEDELKAHRRLADMAAGALQATRMALADLDQPPAKTPTPTA